MMYMDFSPDAQAEEKHQVFGDRQYYWTKYDHLANRHDKEMLERFNDHLDVLLLFAGLFAGIETAFISLTLVNLSPNISQQTNYLLQQLLLQASNKTFLEINPPSFEPAAGAIRQNCFFFASLCSSLMAATGALLGKQWLRNYECVAYTGSPENQALHRTEKFLALEAWGLHVVVEALPTFLLLSFAFFFIALIDYLWSIHHVLAMVVLAFSGTGALAYLFTLIAAAIDSRCPYQTPVSLQIQAALSMLGRIFSAAFWWQQAKKVPRMTKAMARAYGASLEYLWAFWSELKKRRSHDQPATSSFCQFLKHCRPWVSNVSRDEKKSRALRRLGLGHRSALEKEDLYAQSIVYLLKYSTSVDDLRSVADNIPALTHPEPVRLIARSPFFPRLLNQLIQARLGLQCEQNHKLEEDALAYSAAVAHVLAADPTTIRDMIYEAIRDRDTRPRQSRISRDVFALEVGIVGLCLHAKPSLEDYGEVGLSVLAAGRAAGVSNLETSTKAVIQTLDVIKKQSALAFSTLLALSGSALATSKDYITKIPPTNEFFSLAALSLRQEIESGIGTSQTRERRVDDVWSARTGKHVESLIITALNAHSEFLSAPRQRNSACFLQPYITLIRRFRELHPRLCNAPYHSQASKQHNSSRMSASWETVATLTCISNITSSTAQDAIVGCLSKLALLFCSSTPALSRTTLYANPDTERDLKAYALQLFLSLDCRALLGDVWCLSQLQASAVAQALMTLDLRGVVADAETRDVLQVLGSILTSLPSQRDAHRVISHPSISVLIIQALQSSSIETSHSAFELLDYVGSNLEGGSDTASELNVSQSIGGDLGCAVIHSLTWSLARGNTPLRDVIVFRRLLRWIALSVTTDPSLAIPFAQSGVAHFFQLVVPLLSRELVEGSGWELVDTQNAIVSTTLFIGMLYMQTHAAISDPMSDAEYQALAQYVRELVPKIKLTHETPIGHVDILVRQTLSFVEHAVRATPAGECFTALDGARDLLEH